MQQVEEHIPAALDLHRAAAEGGAPISFTSTCVRGLAIVDPVSHGSTMAGIELTTAQRPFVKALGTGHQFVLYDQRGAGESAAAGAPQSWRQRAEDLWAVADAAGVERAVLYGVFDAGHTIAHAAALHPERVLGLIFNRVPLHFGGSSLAGGLTAGEVAGWFPNGTRSMMQTLAIASQDAATLADAWDSTVDPAAVPAIAGLLREANLAELLPELDLPSLVLVNRRRPAMAPWGEALASRLAHGRLVETTNGGEALGAIHGFLAIVGAESGRSASKVAADLSGTLSASTRSVGALRRIVVPVDPNVVSGRAVELACRLGESQQAEIVLVHVLCVPHALPLDHPLPEARHRGERALALGEAIVAEHGLPSRSSLLTGRSVAGSILQLARDEVADLIIISQAGAQSAGREEIGRTVQEIARRAPCEVIIDDPGPVQYPGGSRPEAVRS